MVNKYIILMTDFIEDIIYENMLQGLKNDDYLCSLNVIPFVENDNFKKHMEKRIFKNIRHDIREFKAFMLDTKKPHFSICKCGEETCKRNNNSQRLTCFKIDELKSEMDKDILAKFGNTKLDILKEVGLLDSSREQIDILGQGYFLLNCIISLINVLRKLGYCSEVKLENLEGINRSVMPHMIGFFGYINTGYENSDSDVSSSGSEDEIENKK